MSAERCVESVLETSAKRVFQFNCKSATTQHILKQLIHQVFRSVNNYSSKFD
jgi:hypothetical protein